MWYVIKVGEFPSDVCAIAWERDVHQGYVSITMDGQPSPVLTMEHRTASRLCSAMNREIELND